MFIFFFESVGVPGGFPELRKGNSGWVPSATSICVKIIVSWEADARYSISTKNGVDMCLKDIVSNTSLDLSKVLSQFLFCNVTPRF